MRILLILLIIVLVSCKEQIADEQENFITPFEISKGIETATYEETIEFYKELAREFPQINIQTIGNTDIGIPLHIATFNPESDFNFQKLTANKTILFLNNGIHPGESDGIDATMMLFRDLALQKITTPKNTIIVTIPIYNIGGSLDRSAKTRVNQNGPAHYGFRGNALNFDLNRDFIKSDTKNSRTFAQIFHLVKPDVFVDSHVSNGADYQYTLSHLFTQHDKLGGELGDFVERIMIPQLEKSMEEAGWPVTPYVNIFNAPPESGFSQFMDYPRYSTGFTSLWNTLGLMIESHMLKPYDQRVDGTFEFLKQIISFCDAQHEEIKAIRNRAKLRHNQWDYYPTKWELDSTRFKAINFKGFQADTLTSEITGKARLKYNPEIPISKEIKYYNFYSPIDSVKIPDAYIFGKQWEIIVELMELNGITYTQLEKDSLLRVESYRIDQYNTSPYPYEGHYPHYDTTVIPTMVEKYFSQGDYLIPTDQEGIRYLLETLEPATVDSFFNWNFFDMVLQQKEGFSPYVFEDLALQILSENPGMRDSLEAIKAEDLAFKEDWYAQLQWIYERSEYYEDAHMQYPVYRILAE